MTVMHVLLMGLCGNLVSSFPNSNFVKELVLVVSDHVLYPGVKMIIRAYVQTEWMLTCPWYLFFVKMYLPMYNTHFNFKTLKKLKKKKG